MGVSFTQFKTGSKFTRTDLKPGQLCSSERKQGINANLVHLFVEISWTRSLYFHCVLKKLHLSCNLSLFCTDDILTSNRLQLTLILYVFSNLFVISTMACIIPEQQSGTVFILNLLQIIVVWQRYCMHPITHNRRKIIIRHAQTLTMSLFGPQMYQRDLWWIQAAWHQSSSHHLTGSTPFQHLCRHTLNITTCAFTLIHLCWCKTHVTDQHC